jgi:16S rRNA C967 or C1407 C5-methylase (RsmB/RsmF family)
MQLPDDFIQLIRPVFGEERFARFLQALSEEAPVSIRVNPRHSLELRTESGESAIPWCRNAFYLSARPNFTFDPLLHAGCYYVQEASSMFLDEVLRQHLPSYPVMALDLCAAPGGKSTLMRSALPDGSVLYSNEPIPKRASILLENVEKWGYEHHIVTNCYPKDYKKSKLQFDVILCDVPCSGEGMFRKDPDSIKEWSLQHVQQCQQLQRDIVSNAWQCLVPGGLLIYSTCTYNTREDEENVRWMMEEFDAEPLSVHTEAEWSITGSLLEGFTAPVYRFIPGYTKGEGLFMAVMRKKGERQSRKFQIKENSLLHQLPKHRLDTTETQYPQAELSYTQSIAFLRGEALVLSPDVPRGIVTVTFKGYPLGQVKNIGNRANNLYPKEWRIRSTHIPSEYQPVLTFV